MDGADFHRVKHWIEDDELPILRRMMENGASGILKSTFPAYSPPAWTSIVTGKNPGKHGIFDFVELRNGETRVVSSTTRRAKAIWNILTEKKKKVIAVNVPLTYPPEKVNGVMISGLPTPGIDSRFTYPQELRRAVVAKGYRILEGARLNDPEALKESILGMCNVATWLLKDFEWDFFMVVLQETDQILHSQDLWLHASPQKKTETVSGIYRIADRFIGSALDSVPENTYVMVLSDHGFEISPRPRRVFFVNNWLESIGLAKIRRGKYLRMAYGVPPLRRAVDLILRILPWKVFLGLASPLAPWSPKLSDFSLSETKALSLHRPLPRMCGIRVNVAGRDKHGIVKRGAEYDAVVKRIMQELSRLRDPESGEEVVGEICKKEDVYHGIYAERAPWDLLVRLTDLYDSFGSVDPLGRIISEPIKAPYHGTHGEDGLFVVSGPGIKRGQQLKSAVQTWDVLPTVLTMMDVAVPSDVDGRVPDEIEKG